MCMRGHDSHRTHRSSSDKTPVSMSPTPLHSLFNEFFCLHLLFHLASKSVVSLLHCCLENLSFAQAS